MQTLFARSAWIFDLDGTLTLAAHDFDAIRAELGLPDGPILESIARRSADEAAALHQRLADIERDIARSGRPQPGARELLERLTEEEGRRLGIVTRNRRDLALITLEAAGLLGFFDEEDVLGRDCAAPKPSPAALERLLGRWGRRGDEAVMVGDYLFDLQAGRAVGAATVHLDVDGAFAFADWADVGVRSLGELLA